MIPPVFSLDYARASIIQLRGRLVSWADGADKHCRQLVHVAVLQRRQGFLSPATDKDKAPTKTLRFTAGQRRYSKVSCCHELLSTRWKQSLHCKFDKCPERIFPILNLVFSNWCQLPYIYTHYRPGELLQLRFIFRLVRPGRLPAV